MSASCTCRGIIGIGERANVLILQDIKGSSEDARVTFGNADHVSKQLTSNTDLKYAEIDLYWIRLKMAV